MRECGLKHTYTSNGFSSSLVTPHAGVWIETDSGKLTCVKNKSLPMRECGLKLDRQNQNH